MLRFLLGLCGAALIAPAGASAAAFGELPFRPVSGAATCLRATGAPDELVRQTQKGLEFLTVTSAGLAPGDVLAADGINGCAAVRARPGGAGLMAYISGGAVEDTRLRAAVREPGQGWAAVAVFLRALDAALSDRGDALVAMSVHAYMPERSLVRVARRLPGGAFAAPKTLFEAAADDPFAPGIQVGLSAAGEAIVLWASAVTPLLGEHEERGLWAAIAPAGGAARRDGVHWSAACAVTLPLSGGTAEPHTLGAEVRETDSITPLGSTGVAWTDHDANRRDGRLHLALGGAAEAPDPAAPTVRVQAPRNRVLKVGDDLVLTFRCSAACDVRAQADPLSDDTISLRRAGEAQLKLRQGYQPLATLRDGPVEVLLRYAAPGARRATKATRTLQLRRAPGARRPRVIGARARRAGDDVMVTWRTDINALAENFIAFASVEAKPGGTPLGGGEPTGSRRSFRLRVPDADAARYVTILSSVEGAWTFATTTVKVQG